MAIPLFKLIDKILGIPLSWTIGTLSRIGGVSELPKEPRRILLIKLWAIGDSIVMMPLIQALRARFPKAEIGVLCRKRNKEVFECTPGISAIHLFEPNLSTLGTLLRGIRRYDVVIDGEPYLRLSALLSWLFGPIRIGWGGFARSKIYTHTVPFDRTTHMVKNYLAMGELLDAHYKQDHLVKPLVSDIDKKQVTTVFESLGIRSTDHLIAACPSVAESSKSRQWMPDRFSRTLDILSKEHNAKNPLKIVFIGGKSDLETINDVRHLMTSESIILAGKLNLSQTFEALSRCRLVISVDTGPMHAAAAAGAPTIGLFGPNIPTLWTPYGPKNRGIYHQVECSPCIINEKGQMPPCRRATDKYLCMKRITVEEVVKTAEEIHGHHHA